MSETFAAKLESPLARLRGEADRLGIKPETAVQYATGDARRFASIQRKAAEIDATIALIEEWIAAGAPTRSRTSGK